jgi:uncharacterized membrane protein
MAGVSLGGAALLVLSWRLRGSRSGYALALQGGGCCGAGGDARRGAAGVGGDHGAALLGVVIAKLFVVDLSRVGSVERIVSFVGVGLLMLVVGYVSPLPPAQEIQPPQ